MEWSKRVVTSTPLPELWDPNGPVDAKRIRELSHSNLASLLQNGAVQFVTAEAGKPLEWMRKEDCFIQWKTNIKDHIADPATRIHLDTFSDGYCYLASEWLDSSGRVIVVLEFIH